MAGTRQPYPVVLSLCMKVFIGMSGGVDSSVSAALLKEAGHEVTGVFIKTWHPDFLTCTWREDRNDAMQVAATLGIPFMTLDLEEVYKREVVDYMIREYAAGRTPNPDVMCNQHVKFGAFFTWARAQGADAVATGHYARIVHSTMREAPSSNNQVPNKFQDPNSKNSNNSDQKPEARSQKLLQGVDVSKDQSYFLWTLPQAVLQRVMFPVGSMKKTDVRAAAERFGLTVAHKKDSQGVCFLGEVDIKAFLRRFIHVTPGSVLDEDGRAIGTHDGALLYTLGERRGFTITQKTPNDAARYIIAKDVAANTITVSSSPREVTETLASRAVLEEVNWTRDTTPEAREELFCRFRYRQPLIRCRYEQQGDEVTVVFDTPATFVTPGQSLVLYKGEECLGGGIIGNIEHTT